MNIGGGWTCANCKAWVPSGVTHTCTWNIGAQPTTPPDPTWQLIQALYNVQRELARIADVLEKGAEARAKS